MPMYTVRAITDSGKTVKVVKEASSEADLFQGLEKAGLHVTRVLSAKTENMKANAGWSIKKQQLIDLSDRLQIMYSSGIPMVEAMDEVLRGTKDRRVRAIVHQIKTDIEEGTSFSEAISRFPNAFPPQYKAAVMAGEASGALDVVMDRMVKQLEWELQIKSTTTQAFIYPGILACAVGGMIVMLFTFLLPRLTKVFVETGVELPGPTRFVIATSDFLRANGIFLLAGIALAIGSFFVARRTEGGKLVIDRALINLPLVGTVMRKIASARFVAALRTLHQAGTPMLSALHLSIGACGNATVEKDVLRVTCLVEDGVSLTEAMARSEQLEPLVPRMIAVGEKSGSLTEALDHVVVLYDREVRNSTKKLLTFLEPAILVVSGGVIAFIVLATLMPMFKMLGSIR